MKEERGQLSKQEFSCHLWGWILFIVCALFFIASALKNQDPLTLTGSVVFLVACIIFLIPLLRSNRKTAAKPARLEDGSINPNHKRPDQPGEPLVETVREKIGGEYE